MNADETVGSTPSLSIDPKPRRKRRVMAVLLLLGLAGLLAGGVGMVHWVNRPDADLLRREGHAAYLSGDYQLAVKLADQALTLNPEDTEAAFLAGKARESLGEYERAIEDFSRIGESDRELYRDARYRMGHIWMHRLGRPTEAENAFRDVLRVSPNHVETLADLTMLLGVASRQNESIPLILRLFKQGQVTVDWLTLLSDSEGRLENPELMKRFREQSPSDPNVQLALGWEVWNSPRFVDLASARKILEKGLAAHPRFLPLREALVKVLWELGDAAEVAAHLKYCFEENPVSVRLWVIRGELAEQDQQPQAAARCYWEAYRIAPANRESTFHLAEILAQLGKNELAEPLRDRLGELRELKQAQDVLLNSEHTSTEPLRTVVTRLERVGRLWEAWGWCQIAAKIAPGETWPRTQAASYQTELKRCPESQVCTQPFPVDMDISEFPLPSWKSLAHTPARPNERESSPAVSFRNDAETAGLQFQYFNSPHAENEGQRMCEFPGGGCGVLDYDGDGWPDLYLTQGCRWPVDENSTAHVDRLFRNLGNGRFQDVTKEAKLNENRFSSGVAVGDFDNDGFPDLYIANLGRNRLYHNNGDGTFEDVTATSNTDDPAWTSSCVMVDLNGDTLPDIYSVNYLKGPDVYERICRHGDGKPRMCMPFQFEGAQDQLFLNRGDGRFQNITATSGIEQPDGKGLGVIAADFTEDGLVDLFIANDTVMNFLFINLTPSAGGAIRLTEEALVRGVALNGSGKAEGCMGIAVDDANGDGRLDLFVTNFHQETNTLFLQTQPGLFHDLTRRANLANSSLTQLGFGTQFLDADLDGQQDLIVTNGHIDDLSPYGRPYKMPTQFFYNRGKGRFRELPPREVGEWFKVQALGRAMAKCDWNRDGKEDVVISYLDRPAALLTNRTEHQNNFLVLRFCGVDSARDAFGLKVHLTAGGTSRTLQLTAAGGYQASNQTRLVVGLGSANRVEELEIEWPSGRRQHFQNLPSNREWVIQETAEQPLSFPK